MLVACLTPLSASAASPSLPGLGSDWPMAGQNPANTRDAAAETTISPSNVANLKVKWSFTANGDVNQTPAVANGVAYITDHGTTSKPSTLWAINSSTGQVIWSHSISSYTGIAGDTSRSTPTVTNGMLILGDQAPLTSNAGAWLFAVSQSTGSLLWKTQIDSNPSAVATSSPSVFGSLAIVGVSSDEEQKAGSLPGYPCCTFRGSVVAVDTSTGHIVWKTYMTPDNGGKPGGYSGDAVWGSSPAIDALNFRVYVGTGNAYTVPAGTCAAPGQTGCTPPVAADHDDSIVALNLLTGAIIWATPTLTSDTFTTACTIPGEVCGPDFDFGSGPNFYTATVNGQPKQLVGIGQKSGVYYALDPATGKVVWQTKVGPGTLLGGIEWGSATDGKRIYVAESDLYGVPYTVNGKTITGGSWAALDAGTGQLLWQTPDPQGAPDLGFMSIANGVVYAPSDAGSGTNMYALDAATGAIKWSFASGGSVISGASIVNGTVYWGSGYYVGQENNKLYAFGL
jgi:polyvinyl alcohol dehydrogenase (cytochrome)